MSSRSRETHTKSATARPSLCASAIAPAWARQGWPWLVIAWAPAMVTTTPVRLVALAVPALGVLTYRRWRAEAREAPERYV